MGIGAFSDCDRLESIVISKAITSIEEDTFYYCTRLKNITIPESVIYINPRVFDYCNDLTIICEKGSYAQKYAETKGYKIVLINE
jgi:hypothetical protein